MANQEESGGHDSVSSSLNNSEFVVLDESDRPPMGESTGGSFFFVSPNSSVFEHQDPSQQQQEGHAIDDEELLASQFNDQQQQQTSSSSSSSAAAMDASRPSPLLKSSLLAEDNLFNNHPTPPSSPKIRVRSKSDGTLHLIPPSLAQYLFPELMSSSFSLEAQSSSSFSSSTNGSDAELVVDASSFLLEGIIEFAQHMQCGEKALDLDTDKPFILERFPTRIQLEQLLVFLRHIKFEHMITGVEDILRDMSTQQPPVEEKKLPPVLLPPSTRAAENDEDKSTASIENDLPILLRWALPAATATVLGVGALVLLKTMR